MFSAWTTWWSSWIWPEETHTTGAAATTPATAAAVAVATVANADHAGAQQSMSLASIAFGALTTVDSRSATTSPMATTVADAANRTVSQLLLDGGRVAAASAGDAAAALRVANSASTMGDGGDSGPGSRTATAVHRRLTDVAAALLQNGTAWMLAPLHNDSDIDVNDTATVNNGYGSLFLDTADFSEDELLFRTIWDTATNSTPSTPAAGSPSGSSTGGAAFTFPGGAAAAAGDASSWWLLLANGTNGTGIDGGGNNATLLADSSFDWLTPDVWQQLVGGVTAVLLGFVILATVIGNVFVIAAILLERNLQSVANYLILSLAVADLLVAGLVMPMSAIYLVSDEWTMGAELCDMWTSSDVLCCTASILHLVAIALDRYWAVTNIDYMNQRTARRIGIMIAIVWALSVLVAAAPLFGWKDPHWLDRIVNDRDCMVSQDLGYQIFATASSFYVPLAVILVLYWRIFQAARKRIHRRQQISLLTAAKVGGAITATSGGLIASAAGGSGGIAAAVITIIGRPLPTISETTTAFTNVSSANTSPERCSQANQPGKGCADRRSEVLDDPPTADYVSAGGGCYPMPMPTQPAAHQQQQQKSARKKLAADSKRERKAAKTLAIITGAFVCCWLPFFILAIVLPTCGDRCAVPEAVANLFLWLGYFNSTLNPIIYTIFSPEFRNAFNRLLCGKKRNIQRRTGVMRR